MKGNEDMGNNWKKAIEQAKAFTEAYRRHEHDDISLREAACLRAQFPAALCEIQAGDMYAGRTQRPLVGYIIGYDTGEIGYICRWPDIQSTINNGGIPDALICDAQEIVGFWRDRTTINLAERLNSNKEAPETLNALLSPDYGSDWKKSVFAANTMYRFAEINLDFDKLLQNGIDGMTAIISERMGRAEDDGARHFCAAMLDTMELVRECCIYYAGQAEALANSGGMSAHVKTLAHISNDLRAVAARKPEHLTEAISLFWLYANMAYLDNYGRMDIYLGDFYAHDLDSGYLNESQALEAVSGLFSLINNIYPTSGRVIIGGMGRRNEANADRFALCAIKAQRIIKGESPSLSLRFYKGMNPMVYAAGVDAALGGGTFPFLYNDDVCVPGIERSYGVTREEAEQYVMSNCGEYNIDHISAASPSGSVNYSKILELTLHNGVDLAGGKRMLLQTGNLEDYQTFEGLWEAFEKQVENIIGIVTRNEMFVYEAIKRHSHNLLASALIDDCIENGAGLLGGARYRGLIMESHTMTAAADSLYAIKKLVFDEKSITPERMRELLRSNFDGGPAQHKMMMNVPKFGNDDAGADAMAVRVFNMIAQKTAAAREGLDIDFCLPSHISVDAYMYLGYAVGATPDGRKAGEHLTNSNNPRAGQDKSGITALLNSMAKIKLERSAGHVNHIKLNPSMVKNNRREIGTLLETFFGNGGNYLSVSVLSRQEMLDAMREPSKHRNLMVRIGGFSARFVNLPRELQEEVIARTEYA